MTNPSTERNELSAYQQLLDAGFPAWQIADQVMRHLAGLRQLPANTEGIQDAIARAEAFIEKIPPLERFPTEGTA